ncbi:MAG: glycoside hydrolase family 31 protein [Phycisphaerales bacterium]
MPRTRLNSPLARAALALVALTTALAPAHASPVAERLADGVVRVWPDHPARDAAQPSFALLPSVHPLAPADPTPIVTPQFEWEGDRFTVTLPIDPGTSLYGTGEAAGPLLRNGRVTECWNSDAYEYDANTPSLYASHPWVLAVRADGSSFGVLADTTSRCQIDLRGAITFRADGPAFPVVLVRGATPAEVVSRLAMLTGLPPMPPKWALGYHQSRFTYTPAEHALEVARTFRERAIPCDAIWFDIDYMDGFRVFTFDPRGFPDPAALDRALEREGFRTVWMIDPGVKNEPGYAVKDSGDAHDVWVRAHDGSVFTGEVWPGECVFPDFLNADVRAWWADLYKPFMSTGVDGVWNDMNEPTVFDTPKRTMPLDALHRADPDLGGPDTHARYHNVYGAMMVRATREGILAANPDRRPFVLTRASFVGSQRDAWTWTGDNVADWAHVEMSVPMTLNLGLSGQPFSGPDIGGFVGAGTPEQFARWMGVGALLPFARGHTDRGNIDKEPWAFGPEVEATCRRALERRSRLMPYLYTLAEEASRTGVPVARPVFFADPTDAVLRSEDDAFLLGEALLVVPQLIQGANRVPTLPRAVRGVPWRSFELVEGGESDPDLPELRLRPGAILPVGPVMQHVGATPSERNVLTLIVNLDAEGRAQGEMYEDAGDGFGYQRGQLLRTRYAAECSGDTVRVTIERSEGAMPRPARTLTVRVLLDGGRSASAVGRDGDPVVVTTR